jgi:hypothetical protein
MKEKLLAEKERLQKEISNIDSILKLFEKHPEMEKIASIVKIFFPNGLF